MKTFVCKECEEQFQDYVSNKRKYCSIDCRNKSYKGEHFSRETEFEESLGLTESKLRELYWEQENTLEEVAEIVGASSPGSILSAMKRYDIERRSHGPKGENNYWYGKTGEEHNLWEGGVPNYYGKNWNRKREERLNFDNYTCQSCGSEKKLEVHHHQPIRTFEEPEDANFLFNLITLCKKCHKKLEDTRR